MTKATAAPLLLLREHTSFGFSGYDHGAVRTNTQKTPRHQKTPKDATTGDQKALKRHQKTIKEAKRPQK